MQHSQQEPGNQHAEPTLEPVKTLVIAAGGAANETATYIKAHADGDPAIDFVAADVMSSPATVFITRNGIKVAVSLERDLEYVRIGVDMDMAAIWAESRADRRQRTLVSKILSRCRTSPSASVEIGTEARRLLAYAAFCWSRPEIEAAVERAVRRLADVRLKDRNGNVINNAPMNVMFISSIAGGVGAGTVFPFIGLVKQVMSRVGLPLHRSLFTMVAIGPSAFPATDLRLSNAFETLRDFELAQKKGVVLCND